MFELTDAVVHCHAPIVQTPAAMMERVGLAIDPAAAVMCARAARQERAFEHRLGRRCHGHFAVGSGGVSSTPGDAPVVVEVVRADHRVLNVRLVEGFGATVAPMEF